jgi:hypothetical protein
LSIGPVIRYLPIIVVAHNIWRCGAVTDSADVICSTATVMELSRSDETIHLPAVDVSCSCGSIVVGATVDQLWIMVRFLATTGAGVGYTNSELAVLCARQTVCTRVGAKIAIKGVILLHDHDYMLNLITSIIKRGSGSRRPCCCSLDSATSTTSQKYRSKEASC